MDDHKKMEYNSYVEYLKEFFPESTKQQMLKDYDPRKFGINMANQSLSKLAKSLPQCNNS